MLELLLICGAHGQERRRFWTFFCERSQVILSCNHAVAHALLLWVNCNLKTSLNSILFLSFTFFRFGILIKIKPAVV